MFLISFGGPVLGIASLFIFFKTWIFYWETKGSPFGKLVVVMNTGWLVTMYSLALVSAFYLFRDISAIRIVFPLFVVWLATLLILLYLTTRWSAEAATLHGIHARASEAAEHHAYKLDAACKRELENEKKVEQLKDEILFVAAHELRSPVSAIKWGLTTLMEDKEFNTHISNDLKKILRNIYTHNERLGELVSRLLNTARIERGVLSIKTENVFLAKQIQEVVVEVKLLTEENNIKICNETENPPPVLADPVLAKEIITNLVVNAIRYNKPDGTVTITERHTDAAVIISIADTGQGIPANKLEHIFQKFHSIKEKQTLGKEKSVGLGLYITKELVTRMGGTIRATSELGKGSTFTFTLPRERN